MESYSRWKEIWNKKGIVNTDENGDEFQEFCKLKKANGFDVAVGDEEAYFRLFYYGWLDFYEMLIDLAGLNIDSVFEVGVGSGVNLFMFKNRLPEVKLGGVDYSEPMIISAKRSTGSNDFICCGADKIAVTPKYDVVMSESVFQYFDSVEYAEIVLRKMIQKSNLLTYLGEIHNKDYEKELIDYRRKSIENYDERYKGLNKLFLDKDWIREIAAQYGKKVLFTDVNNSEYLNGNFEYNCFIF